MRVEAEQDREIDGAIYRNTEDLMKVQVKTYLNSQHSFAGCE